MAHGRGRAASGPEVIDLQAESRVPVICAQQCSFLKARIYKNG